MPSSVTSAPIATDGLGSEFTRADIEFHGVDHAGASYEGRVFLNLPEADEQTPRTVPQYAGCFHIFGHGGCLGDAGHCDVLTRRVFDPRPAHPLTRVLKVVIATDAIRHALAAAVPIAVTVVPVISATTVQAGRPDDLLQYEAVRIVTYA
jgi:tyrosinase